MQVPPQSGVESVLLQTVQQQQNQVAQLTTLVQTLVSRESAVKAEKGKGDARCRFPRAIYKGPGQGRMGASSGMPRHGGAWC